MNKIVQLYYELLKKYGPQGWWPCPDYHPGDYSFPKTADQRFEICVGAILTQNTAWTNVEKALLNLKRANALNLKNFLKLSDGKLRELIKPAGYFNQKAKKLQIFAKFLHNTPTRELLLNLWGIGPETADSMLLYAYKQPFFVVDTYTKRLFPEFKDLDYEEIRKKFETALPKDYKMYQEYHALIVKQVKYHSKV